MPSEQALSPFELTAYRSLLMKLAWPVRHVLPQYATRKAISHRNAPRLLVNMCAIYAPYMLRLLLPLRRTKPALCSGLST